MTQVIGWDKTSLYELATKRGMHPGSANALMEFAAEIQQRALTHEKQEAGLDRMHENEVEVGLVDETEGSTCD
jgi:hypothetical protein